MVRLEPTDLVDDAIVMPSLKLAEACYDERGMRDPIDVG